jgi:Ca2+-binding RTX toxin-like protein
MLRQRTVRGVGVSVETLEKRSLLSAAVGPVAYIDGATLRVLGDRRFGTVINVSTADEGDTILVRFGSQPTIEFSRDEVSAIRIEGGRARDRITVREDDGLLELPLSIAAREGNDYIDLDRSPAKAWGGPGNDTVLGSDGDDDLEGNENHDKVYGGPGDDTLKGFSGNDDLRGDGGQDELDGGSGNDNLDGGTGSDVLDGGTGFNRLVDRAARGELNIFYGGLGRNDIFGTTTDEYRDIDPWYDRVYTSRPIFSREPIQD